MQVDNIVGPIADSFGNELYGMNTTRENLLSVLGKRKRKTNSVRALERKAK